MNISFVLIHLLLQIGTDLPQIVVLDLLKLIHPSTDRMELYRVCYRLVVVLLLDRNELDVVPQLRQIRIRLYHLARTLKGEQRSRRGSVVCQYALRYILPLVFEVRIAVEPFYLRRTRTLQNHFFPQTLHLLVDHQIEPFLQLLVHLLAPPHKGYVVATILLLQQEVDDIDQILQDLVDQPTQRHVSHRWRKRLQQRPPLDQFSEGLGTTRGNTRRPRGTVHKVQQK